MVAVVTGAVGCGKIRTISQWLPGQDTAVMSTNGTPIHWDTNTLGHSWDTTQNRYLVRRTSLGLDSRHCLASGQVRMNTAQQMIDVEAA